MSVICKPLVADCLKYRNGEVTRLNSIQQPTVKLGDLLKQRRQMPTEHAPKSIGERMLKWRPVSCLASYFPVAKFRLFDIF